MNRLILSRHVWYFHGFDPASTARYRRIFSSAAERLDVDVQDLPGDAEGWRALRGEVVTDFHYLRYDALVRDAQAGNLFSRIGRGVRAVIAMMKPRAYRHGRPGIPALTWALAISPLLVAFLPLVVATPWLDRSPVVAAVVLTLGLSTAWMLLLRMKMLLASDLFAYMQVLASGKSEAAETWRERVRQLSSRIAPTGDETVVVGHSLGGLAALMAVDEMLHDWPEERAINLLTLGSVHGIVLADRGEGRDALDAAIGRIARDKRVTWVDVSSPRDAFTIPLTDPLLMLNDEPEPGATSPLVISAQLRDVPAIPGDTRTLFRAMRRHMGYLLAAPAGAGFDYAETVTGSVSFGGRFRMRDNSPKARMWRA